MYGKMKKKQTKKTVNVLKLYMKKKKTKQNKTKRNTLP